MIQKKSFISSLILIFLIFSLEIVKLSSSSSSSEVFTNKSTRKRRKIGIDSATTVTPNAASSTYCPQPHYPSFNGCIQTEYLSTIENENEDHFLENIFDQYFDMMQASQESKLEQKSKLANVDLLDGVEEEYFGNISQSIGPTLDSGEKIKLKNELVQLIITQLNLNPNTKIRFTDFIIVNWPPFTSLYHRTWDAVNITDIRAAMSRLKFYPKIDYNSTNIDIELREGEDTICNRYSEKSRLLELLLAKFQEQVDSISNIVPWGNISIKGWPVGIDLCPNRWSQCQVNKIWRLLDKIEFRRIEPGDNRTITYINGQTITLETFEPFKTVQKRRKNRDSNKNITYQKIDGLPTSLGKRNMIEEQEQEAEGSSKKKFTRPDHASRLIKGALAADLRNMFIQQTGDDLKNYYKYDIENYPVDSSKRGHTLTLAEVDSIRNVFDTLKFYKAEPKNFNFSKAFANEPKSKLSKGEARHILYERYCRESEDGKALRINWNLVDLSQIPEKFLEAFETIKSGSIFDYGSIFRTIEIFDNIHFFPAKKEALAKKIANPLIEARRVLLEQYRKDLNLPKACRICWDHVEKVVGLDGINFLYFNASDALEIMKRKNFIKFEPKAIFLTKQSENHKNEEEEQEEEEVKLNYEYVDDLEKFDYFFDSENEIENIFLEHFNNNNLIEKSNIEEYSFVCPEYYNENNNNYYIIETVNDTVNEPDPNYDVNNSNCVFINFSNPFVESTNSQNISYSDLGGSESSVTEHEIEDPSKMLEYVRSDHKCRLLKKSLAADLKSLFIQQTGDDIKNYYNYDIENFPADSSKHCGELTLAEVKSIRNVFDSLKFYKVVERRKKLNFFKSFSDESKYKIKKKGACNILFKRYRDESGDTESMRINWKLVDLSQIPEKFAETFEIIKSGRIFAFKSIFKIIAIFDNIHFFPEDKNVIARKKANPLIEARRILLEQYRHDMNLPDARKICWDLVQKVSGLDGINYLSFKKSAALKIINGKNQIKFIPKDLR